MTLTRRTWLFQANPARYRIQDSLRQQDGELWNLNQHADAVREGDRVLIWMSGPEAGVYAIGTVLGDPDLVTDSPEGQAYWTDAKDGTRARQRVPVRYDRSLLDRPLLKAYLVHDPELDGLSVIRQPRGTNFPVSDAEWSAIDRWLRDGDAVELSA